MGWNYLSIPKLQLLQRWNWGIEKLFHPTFYWACDYLSVLTLKLIHVSKRGYRWLYHCSLTLSYVTVNPLYIFCWHGMKVRLYQNASSSFWIYFTEQSQDYFPRRRGLKLLQSIVENINSNTVISCWNMWSKCFVSQSWVRPEYGPCQIRKLDSRFV